MRILGRIAAIAITAAFCAWAIWQWAVVPVQCNAALTSITAATKAADTLPAYAQEQRANHNIEELNALRPHCRAEVRVPFLLGVNESMAGRHDRAMQAFQDALTLDRRPEIYLSLGGEQIVLGRSDEAVESFLTAARFNAAPDETMTTSDEVWRRVQERLHAH